MAPTILDAARRRPAATATRSMTTLRASRPGRRLDVRRVASITSWFFHPELNMAEEEVLSRSSCFAVTSQGGMRLHFIASKHVTHPFLFPHLYPSPEFDWLRHLTDEHVRATLEIRKEETGEVLFKHDFSRDPSLVVPHPDLDLVVLHADGAAGDFLAALDEAGVMIEPLFPSTAWMNASPEEDPAARDARRHGPHLFTGHTLRSSFDEATKKDTSVLLPTLIPGHILVHEGFRIVADTGAVLEMGMCGGPILDPEGRFVGMVEGTIPDSKPHVGGMAVGIDAKTVQEFVLKVSEDLDAVAARDQEAAVREERRLLREELLALVHFATDPDVDTETVQRRLQEAAQTGVWDTKLLQRVLDAHVAWRAILQAEGVPSPSETPSESSSEALSEATAAGPSERERRRSSFVQSVVARALMGHVSRDESDALDPEGLRKPSVLDRVGRPSSNAAATTTTTTTTGAGATTRAASPPPGISLDLNIEDGDDDGGEMGDTNGPVRAQPHDAPEFELEPETGAETLGGAPTERRSEAVVDEDSWDADFSRYVKLRNHLFQSEEEAASATAPEDSRREPQGTPRRRPASAPER